MKYPEQLAPLLNGEVCDRAYLAHLQHDTEVEIQEAISNLISDGLLTLLSPNTQMATSDLAGAFISKNELIRLRYEMVIVSGISDVIKLDRESFDQDKAESHRRRTLERYTLK